MEIVELLVNAGADLEIRNSSQCTPFLWALDHSKEEVAVYLIEKGANIFALGCKKESAVFIAANKCSGKMVQLLVDKGLDVNQLASAKLDALEWTTGTGNVDGAKALIQNGINKETITPAFWWACRRNHSELAKFLLSQGADITSVCNGNCELLIYICNDTYVDVLKLLKDNQIDFNKKVKYNKNFIKFEGTPLERAIELKQEKVIQVIRSWGTEPTK